MQKVSAQNECAERARKVVKEVAMSVSESFHQLIAIVEPSIDGLLENVG